MDGLKTKLRDSLQFRLSLWLSAASLLVASVAGILSFAAAFEDARTLQDDFLRQMALLLERYQPAPDPEAVRALADQQPEMGIIVQVLSLTPRGDGLLFPTGLADGIQTLTLDGDTYRVLVRRFASGVRVALAQDTDVRDDIAEDSALSTLTPFLILMPALILLIAKLVSTMLKPIADLSTELDQRGEGELHALQASLLPIEVRPFAVAINRLLGRVSESMEAQRRFVAGAAHELRSPMTALSLQAERLAQAPMSDVAGERLVTLRQGIERGRALLDQLLALAREQSQTMSSPLGTVGVLQSYRAVLEDLMPLAAARNIDIGVKQSDDAQVCARSVDLTTIIKNLVDNAIRYTPQGGRVDLSVHRESGEVVLEVEDDGPGIPVYERSRVLEPYYRLLGSDQTGSGLGLSIVKTVVDRLRGSLVLADADSGLGGLKVQVRLPQPADS